MNLLMPFGASRRLEKKKASNVEFKKKNSVISIETRKVGRRRRSSNYHITSHSWNEKR